jgi:hypothetical protein
MVIGNQLRCLGRQRSDRRDITARRRRRQGPDQTKRQTGMPLDCVAVGISGSPDRARLFRKIITVYRSLRHKKSL